MYRDEYLRKPNEEDIRWLTAKHAEVHGFPGMLGSIDCMHWGWRNCHVAWQGQYTHGKKGHPTIMLEAVALYDLWIWHAYFGRADRTPRLEYIVNGQQFRNGYYLTDDIYPEWVTLVKSFKCLMQPQTTKFKRYQEAAKRTWREHSGCFKVVGRLFNKYAPI
uniref:uncharacterized protein LOC122609788 n=1 Tax=Erigeron canadensis TaxID=72917 RepID=UPI001CB981FD|nr:uncharacterized protein LOC122609788 [Erigeron canadensis]